MTRDCGAIACDVDACRDMAVGLAQWPPGRDKPARRAWLIREIRRTRKGLLRAWSIPMSDVSELKYEHDARYRELRRFGWALGWARAQPHTDVTLDEWTEHQIETARLK